MPSFCGWNGTETLINALLPTVFGVQVYDQSEVDPLSWIAVPTPEEMDMYWPAVDGLTISSEYTNFTTPIVPTEAVFSAFDAAESLSRTVSASTGTVLLGRLLIVTAPAVTVSESPDAFPMVVLPVVARSPNVVAPVTPRVVPTVAAPVMLALARVEAPVTDRLARVDKPVTPSVVPIVAALVTARLLSVEAPVTARLPSVESPVTPRVVPTVAAPVTPRLANVESPVTLRVLPIPTAPVSVEMPVTDRVPGIVRPPVIPSVPPIVALPLVMSELSEVAPVTASVPATAVLPLAEATVNLLVATLKSPLMLDATVETWSAESFPEPSLRAFRLAVSVALSVVFSRPV